VLGAWVRWRSCVRSQVRRPGRSSWDISAVWRTLGSAGQRFLPWVAGLQGLAARGQGAALGGCRPARDTRAVIVGIFGSGLDRDMASGGGTG
jgi:hypothetical protein